MDQVDEASVRPLDCSHQSSKSIWKWRCWWMGRIWRYVNYRDGGTLNVWKRTLMAMSPPEEPTLSEKQFFFFWLVVTLSQSFPLLQAYGRSSFRCKHSFISTRVKRLCQTKMKTLSYWPTRIMLTSLMEKDPDLWMSHDLCLFEKYKFSADYMSGFESFNMSTPFQPFNDITLSPLIVQICTM